MKTKIDELIERHDLTLSSSTPIGVVKDDWPCIQYKCNLAKDNREIWSGEYSLGVGHVKLPDRNSFHGNNGPVTNDTMMYNCLKAGKTPADRAGHASFAAKLAVLQKVEPKLPDVLHSLLMDGSAYFDAETFEDWASNYGYDPDSRKADAIWKACDEIGRKLSRAFSADDLAELREAFQDY